MEKSFFWPDGAGGDGALSPYDDQEFVHILGLFLQYDRREESVVDTGHLDFAGGLQVSAAAGSVDIQTGVALVDGSPYTNSAVVNKTIATPATATRIDRVVLQKDYANFVIRIVVLTGDPVTGGGGLPALTQDTAGLTVWEVGLAQVSITTGGVITVTREAVAVRTPLGPGYQAAELATTDSTHTASAWNSLGASGVKISLGPGKWAIQGSIRIKAQASSNTRFARIRNNTAGTVIASGGQYANAVEDATIPIALSVVDLTQNTELELQFYAGSTTDDVYGTTVAEGVSTSIFAFRVV